MRQISVGELLQFYLTRYADLHSSSLQVHFLEITLAVTELQSI